METSVSSRLAYDFGAVSKRIKVNRICPAALMRESSEFRLSLPVPELRSRNSPVQVGT